MMMLAKIPDRAKGGDYILLHHRVERKEFEKDVRKYLANDYERYEGPLIDTEIFPPEDDGSSREILKILRHNDCFA